MRTIKFNTQREYGPKGQRIAARLLANGSTVFVDVDRNIEGIIPVLCDAEFTESIFNYRWVMESYDTNWYSQPQEEHTETIRELRDLILTPAAPAPAAPVQTEMEFAAPAAAPAAPKTKRSAKYKLDVARDVDVDGGGFSGPETYMLHLPFGFRFTSEVVHVRGFDTMKELRAAAKQDVIPCDCASCAAKE
jgi:hypothetical protein